MTESNKQVRSQSKGRKRTYEEVITTHINADFDALASMIAASKLYPGAALVFPGSQEKNLRNFFLHSTSYLFNFVKVRQINLQKIKRLILVDTRQKNRIGKFARLIDRKDLEIHVYDHHPGSDDDVRADSVHVQQVGSTTALLTLLIREKEIPVSADEATIMCLGIHEDTGSFTFSSTTAVDYQAAAWLSEQGAKHNIIADMLTREATAEQVQLLNDLIQSAVSMAFNGIEIVISKVVRDDYVGDFAVLVHKFIEMENLDVVFALAQMEDRIYLVARSRREEVNAAEIALALGGGGHPQAASATIKNKTLNQVERSLQNLLQQRVRPARTAGDMMSSPVIRIGPSEAIKEAANLMTRYNINVLLVMDQNSALQGYITRQIVEKAVFFGLHDLKVSEYMNIEFSTVPPSAGLKTVQDLIISHKLRILPVVDDNQVLGVITRTDLLNILVGESVPRESAAAPPNASHYTRKKNMIALLNERLPGKINFLLNNVGQVADKLDYNAYLVGGLVRDVFLKKDNLDVDIVIEGDGIRFAHEFAARYEARVRSHRKFGTAVLIFDDGFKADIATARMEYYEAPGAPPIVETSSLKLDLYRRDFTINTLAVQLNSKYYGSLVDYFGAQRDIKDRVLRVLHNLSFVEDPTRVFRAIRFEKRFGFKIGKLTLALIKNATKINYFKDVTGRRLFLELKLILMEQDPIGAIERLDEFNLLQFISPEIQLTDNVITLLHEIREVVAWYKLLYLEEPLEAWKVYWHGLTSLLNGKALRMLAEGLGMVDRENRKMVFQRLHEREVLDALYKFRGKNFQLYTLLQPYDTETLLYFMAKANSEKMKRFISNYFTKLKGTKTRLTGKELVQMGFKPGPIFKEIFDGLLEARVNNVLKTKEDEIRFVTQRYPEARAH